MIKSRVKTSGIGIGYRFTRDNFGNIWFMTDDPKYKPAIVLAGEGLTYVRSSVKFPIEVILAARDFAASHAEKFITEYPKHDRLHRPTNKDGSYKKRVAKRVKTRLVKNEWGVIMPKETKTIDLSR